MAAGFVLVQSPRSGNGRCIDCQVISKARSFDFRVCEIDLVLGVLRTLLARESPMADADGCTERDSTGDSPSVDSKEGCLRLAIGRRAGRDQHFVHASAHKGCEDPNGLCASYLQQYSHMNDLG
jgi:hypothetical protein